MESVNSLLLFGGAGHIRCLSAGLSRIELSQSRLWNTFQHFFGEYSEELPTDVQRLKNCSVLIIALKIKFYFKNDSNRGSTLTCDMKFFSNFPKNSK